MSAKKKTLEITGCLLCPIVVGESAFIRETDGMRRTSTVLQLEEMSQTEVRFETCNTNYLLHLDAKGVVV